MTRRSLHVSLFSALCFAYAVWAAQEPEPIGPELLRNGGFEEAGPTAKAPLHWRGFSTRDWGDCAGSVAISQAQPHSGQRCVAMTHVKTLYALAHDRVPIAPGKAYLLTGWVRTELYRGESAILVASWSNRERWLQLTRSRGLRGHRSWTRVSLVLSPESRTKDAEFVQVSFRIASATRRGRAWVDDMSLRQCRIPPPPLASDQVERRQADVARELLVERARWADRLRMLQSRHRDLEQLLAEPASFTDLVAKYGPATKEGRFLSYRPTPHAKFDASVPTDPAAVRRQLDAIKELPELRLRSSRQMDETLRLKRRLDARPDLRRFYLWAQLAPWRAERKPTGQPAPRASAPFTRSCAEPPADALGLLDDAEVRVRLDLAADSGAVTVTVQAPTGLPQARIEAGLFDAQGRLAGFASRPMADDGCRLAVRVASPRRWFPDCPHLYVLKAGLLHDGRALDWSEKKVAFRDVRIVESDVSPTMRHGWKWALTDHTFLINGQPYFPTGTVCGRLSDDYLDDAGTLFRELWLDFQRSYGRYLPRLAGRKGDVFAEYGLSYCAAMGPSYPRIRQYESSQHGLEDYREAVRGARALASHPALLTIEVGNEAELPVWGADLRSYYGRDLWHVFNEVTRVLRSELDPAVPVGYVRATSYRSVTPAPRNDYSGVNQYTGRYHGRRCVIASDLAALTLATTHENRPIGITEWNGPKYSWATRGVSGVDEAGAAQYIFEYFQNMTRSPMVVLSTEFVLNWVVAPIEDLTTMPLAEGLERRAKWHWNLQKGTPWYPSIWPDLLADTPARRAMRGFQSPLFYLCSAPGPILIAARPAHGDSARRLAHAVKSLGRRAEACDMPDGDALAGLDANLLLITDEGGPDGSAVARLEAMGVISPVASGAAKCSGSAVQRRVNPFFPDRFVVVASGADAEQTRQAVEKLLASADGLAEAYARQASCTRALGLIKDSTHVGGIYSTYVLELPTRGFCRGRDDLRSALSLSEFADDDGRLRPRWADLGALVVAADRPLSDDERHLIARLLDQGANVIWSRATLEAAPGLAQELGVEFGPRHELTGHFPVAQWAQEPLRVPDMGDAAADRIQKFSSLKPGSSAWRSALTVKELVCGAGWTPAVTTPDGKPVVVMKHHGKGSQWVFGAGLSQAAAALVSTTRRGVNHHIYDRDTACGLERVFRVMANACAFGRKPRPANTPRLRAEIETDRQLYGPGDVMQVRVAVRDANGSTQDASVRLGLGNKRHVSGLAVPTQWVRAKRQSTGSYTAAITIPEQITKDTPLTASSTRYRGQRHLTLFADVCRPGWTNDWAAHTVRFTEASDEADQAAKLIRLVRDGLMDLGLQVADRAQWVEVNAEAALPTRPRAGRPLDVNLTVSRVEDDRGNDWLEDAELVFESLDGQDPVRLPLAPGKYITAAKASVVAKSPDRCIVVTSAKPARFKLRWPTAKRGVWRLRLSYLYSDDYHIKDTDRLPRNDAFALSTFRVE